MTLYALGAARPRTPQAGRFWVAPNATLIGDVVLEEDASVWFGAILRGDNEPITIGARSNVQDGCVLHTDPGFPVLIGPDCTIGHNAIVHGCSVGPGSLVGMGATILNGARIGRSCLVGANALVTEGKEFPDFSMIIGSPAKAVKTLEPAWEAKLMATAARYVANSRRYASDLSPLR
jgi:carbonic anhydrase/acetyltransferase-like protein (isoleucine patch superfamily)